MRTKDFSFPASLKSIWVGGSVFFTRKITFPRSEFPATMAGTGNIPENSIQAQSIENG
jgi:hypothetical protein